MGCGLRQEILQETMGVGGFEAAKKFRPGVEERGQKDDTPQAHNTTHPFLSAKGCIHSLS